MAKLEVICGPMFAGKTEELIRRVKRCVLAHQEVQVFKPSMDYRFGVDRITSHGKTDLEAATGIRPIAVDDGVRLPIHDKTAMVAFDEVQFFDAGWLIQIVNGLIKDGIRVVCAGLDMNCYGEPFGNTVPALLAMADEVTKLRSICVVCKEDANRTYRETPFPANMDVEVGGSDIYEPRCLRCWKPTPR